MKYFPVIAASAILLGSLSCTTRVQERFVLKGNWYADLKGNTNPMDIHDIRSSNAATNYCEYYVSDSTITFCEGSTMLGYDQKYFIKGDSIYKCLSPEKDCVYIPMYKIESYRSDTLRLIIHPHYASQQPQVFWVRLPKDELGVYDYAWSDTSAYESMLSKAYSDFSRRKLEYYARKNR